MVHPTAVVADGARLGAGVRVGPYAVLGPHVRLGDGCYVGAHAIVDGHTEIGLENRIEAHAVVGGPPQDLKYAGEPTRLVLGDRNRIRESVTINIGTEQGGGETVVGSDCIFMACSHVAHDCKVGDRVILANNVMLAGHVRVEDGAILNGGVGIHHFTTVGRLSYVGGLSRITRDIPPFTIVEGHPSRIRGINVIGLRRAGLAEETIVALKRAFKLLYRSDVPVREAVRRLEEEYGHVEEVRVLSSFVRASESGRHGRQQERIERESPE